MFHQAHAASVTSGTGLDQHWIADPPRLAAQGLIVLFDTLITGDALHTGSNHGQF